MRRIAGEKAAILVSWRDGVGEAVAKPVKGMLSFFIILLSALFIVAG